MPDFGSPVAQNVNINPSSGLDMLSKLLNARQQQQNLQTGAIQQQGLQAEVQQQQQTTQQRQAAAQFFQNYDVSQHVGPDGTIDLNQAFANPQLKATGDAAPVVMQALANIKNAQLAGKTSLAALDSTLRQDFYKNVGGLAADPDVKSGNNQGMGKVLDEIDRFGQSSPEAARVAAIYKPVIQNLQQSGKTAQLPFVLRNFQLQAQDAGSQTEQTYGTSASVDTGPTIQPGVRKPAAEGGGFMPSGPPIVKGLAPTEQPGYKGQLAGVEADTQAYQGARIADAHAPRVIALAQALQGMASQGSAAVANNPTLAKMLRSVGVESSGVANTAIMDKLTANLSRELMAAPRSDADQREIQNMLPDVAKGPEAVRAAADQIIQRAQYDQGKLTYMEKQGISNSRPMGAADAENQYTRNTPAPPTSKQAAPGAGKEGATGRSKSGKPIIFRNGRWEYQ